MDAMYVVTMRLIGTHGSEWLPEGRNMQFVNAQEEWLRTFVVVSCSTLVKTLLAFSSRTLDDLQSHLDELGLTPTRIALYSLQRSFFRHVQFLRESGAADRTHTTSTTRSTQLKLLGAT
jgi:hypothetical protein